MTYVQISQTEIEVRRLPRDQKPVFEFELEDFREFIGIHRYTTSDTFTGTRKTVDHTLTIWTAARFHRDTDPHRNPGAEP